MASSLITSVDKISGRALTVWRNLRGKSRKTAAADLGVSHITVRAWEMAESRPKTERWDQIEQVLGFRWDTPPEETLLIQQAMEKTEGNKAEAAGLLGISRQSLGQKLKKHGLFKPVVRQHLKGAVPAGKRWRSQGHVSGKTRYLGTFDTEQEAHEAYNTARANAVTPQQKPKKDPVKERNGIHSGEEFFYTGKNAKYPNQKVTVKGFGRYDTLIIIQLHDPRGQLEGRPFISSVSEIHKTKPKAKPDLLWVYTGGRGKGKALNGTLFRVLRDMSDTHVFTQPVTEEGENAGKARRINRRFLATVDEPITGLMSSTTPQGDLNRPDTAEVPIPVPDDHYEDLESTADILAVCVGLLRGDSPASALQLVGLLTRAQELQALEAVKLNRADQLARWLQGQDVDLF